MGKLRQAHTSITCSLAILLTGILYVWPSYTLPLYTDRNTTILYAPMTDVESSLVGSLPSLGAMFGTAGSGYIISSFGRQKSGLVLMSPLLMSWIVINLTRSSMIILAARFFMGISSGAFMLHAPLYISEIAEESIRGALASAPIVCYCIGALVSYLIGWFFTYQYVIWINIGLCVMYVCLMMTVKESPVFLMRQNKEEEARSSIAYYRSVSVSSKIVFEEISRIKQQIMPAVELRAVGIDINAEDAEKEKLNKDIEEIEPQQKMSPLKRVFVSPSSRRAFTVVGLLLSLQVMMGMVPVQVYAKKIFSQAAPGLSSHICSVMFALVLLIGSLLSALLADKFGRRILLISSSIAVALCLIGMGILLQTSIAPPWVTALLILCYCFTFMFGAGNVPYVMLAECFIPEVQSVAYLFLMEWVWFLNFFIVGIFPFMVELLGIHGSLYSFACFAVLNVFVGIFLQPETKGLTQAQIQEAFVRRRKT